MTIEKDLSRVQGLFIELREIWFNHHVKIHAHERVWETEEEEERRNKDNKRTKLQYDLQTAALLRGGHHNIAPQCLMDLERP